MGLLSSLGAHRDRSPTGHQPPQKVFVQEQEVLKPETQPQPVPMIVVQEFHEQISQIPAETQPQLESVKDLPYQSKTDAQVLEVKSQDDVVGVVPVGEPKRQKGGDDIETMKFQPHHLDIKQTTEQIQETSTRQQPLTVRQEPKQQQIQLDTRQQSQAQQQVQIQKQERSQQQTLFCQSVKVRKSQKCAENRPWLQQKAKAEVSSFEQVGKVSSEVIATAVSQSAPEPDQAQAKVTLIQQQQPVSVVSQAQVFTTDANQTQPKRVTETHDKVTQAQQQQPVLQADGIQAQQQQPMTVIATVVAQPKVCAMDPVPSEPKSVQMEYQATQVQQQQSVIQTKVGQTQQVTQTRDVEQQQHIIQAKLGQVHQSPPVSQMLAKEQVLAAPVSLQAQPQDLIVQKHFQQFTATSLTQPPTKQSKMQSPPVMAQIQRPAMAQTQLSVMSQTNQYLPAVGEESQTMRHPLTLIQSQITQRQQHPAQSPPQQVVPSSQSQGVFVTPAKPKSTAPIQPRIITMPQGQPQFYKPPQSPPQFMGMCQSHDNIQQRPQSHIQQSQWRPIMPEIMTQNYPEAPQKGFVPSNMPPQTSSSQSHPQVQGVTQSPAQPQQWMPSRGGPVTQTNTSVHGSGHVQPYPQCQGFPSPHSQSQWGQFKAEPTMQPYFQLSPQSPVQPFVPSQHWQPVRQSNMVRQSYAQVQMSEYPEVQHQVTPRPQWPIQPEPQSQVQFLKMFSQPMAYTPWNQPSFLSPVRLQSPALQQPQTHQQQWPQNRSEVSFQAQIQSRTLQSQPQLQGLPKQQSPKQEQNQTQQQLVTQVKPPDVAPLRPQGSAQQQPHSQQQQWPQNRAEAPFQVQIQSQTFQTQPQVHVLQKPQSPVQEQPQQQLVAQAQDSPQAYSESYTKAHALARSKFEDAKHCLQEHIQEAINIIKGKKITHKQVLFKNVFCRSLNKKRRKLIRHLDLILMSD